MTISYTTNYGLAYCDAATSLRDLAAVTFQVASTVDAALGRGGIAPPDATTQAQLAARITSLEGSRTTDEGRLTALEAGRVVAYAFAGTGVAAAVVAATDGTSTEQRITVAGGSVTFTATAGRAYRVDVAGVLNTSSAGAMGFLNVRGKRGGTPAATDQAVATAQRPQAVAGTQGRLDVKPSGLFTVSATGSLTLALFMQVNAGTLTLLTDARGRADISVTDRGPAPAGLVSL